MNQPTRTPSRRTMNIAAPATHTATAQPAAPRVSSGLAAPADMGPRGRANQYHENKPTSSDKMKVNHGKVGFEAYKELLSKKEESIQRMIPGGSRMTAKRLIGTALRYIIQNPKLLLCTDQSVFYSVAAAARLGLDFQGGYLFMCCNQAYEYNAETRKRDIVTHHYASIMPHYKGLILVLDRNGFSATAQAVYAGDHFESGHNDKGYYLDWQIGKDRGNIIGAFARFARKGEAGIYHLEYMSAYDIEQFAPKVGESWAWDGEATKSEMYRKTPLRRGFKYLPPSNDEMSFAVELANRADNGVEIDDMFIDDEQK